MAYSLLRITDGTTHISLLDTEAGFLLYDWMPSISPFKGGGVWQSSPLTDGRRLAMRSFDNGIETMTITVGAEDQDALIAQIQKLTGLLEKAVAYWTSGWQTEPVWIEARGAKETNTRYAVIKSYTLEGLNNPYSQPFFGECRSVMKELTLIIERDHWLDLEPGTETCVAISTTQDVVDTSSGATIHSHVSAGTDDITVIFDEGYGFVGGGTSDTRSVVGYDYQAGAPNWYESGLRFPNVTVPKDAVIIDAYINVYEANTAYFRDDATDCPVLIFGELTDDADSWNNYTYFTRRGNRTSSDTSFTLLANGWHTGGTEHTFAGLGGIVQELVNQNTWASGNAMAFFVTCTQDDESYSERTYEAFEGSDYDPPVLYIEYSTSTIEVGNPATCTAQVYIGNKHNRAQITHAKRYKSSGAVYEDIYTDAPTQYLTFDPPTMGDRLFFCVENSSNTGPFDSVALNISQQGDADMAWDWHYYSDDATDWATLEKLSGNYNLREGGENIISWKQSHDWIQNTVDGVTGFWVMAQITVAGTTGPTPVVLTNGTTAYTILTPFVRMASAQVPGEIPALARIRILGLEEYTSGNDRIVSFAAVGLRSLSRGEQFTPYLNFSDVQKIPGTTFSAHEGFSLYTIAIQDDTLSPTGRDVKQNILAESIYYDEFAYWSFDRTIATQYRGMYHAYLRCYQIGGSAGDVSLKLRLHSSYSSEPVYSQVGFTKCVYQNANNIGLHLVDLGTINFGSSESILPTDAVWASQIYVMFYAWTATLIDMVYYDLILIPIDEWCGIYTTSNANFISLTNDTLLDLDATGSMRTQRAVIRYASTVDLPASDEYFAGEWIRQTRGGPILQANANQRLWFLFAYESSPEEALASRTRNKYSVRVYRNSRYLTMRGAS